MFTKRQRYGKIFNKQYRRRGELVYEEKKEKTIYPS